MRASHCCLFVMSLLVVTAQPQAADQQRPMDGMTGAGQAVDCKGVTPCGCALLGDVGLTTVSGTNAAGLTLSVGENIYGPFEAGFASQQDNILAGLGCATGKGYVAGGIDTKTAEAVVAKDCDITLPRTDTSTNTYVSLLDMCGGHTTAYHFHERLSCLYSLSGEHSTKVGEDVEFKKGIYGKWENYTGMTKPVLDACGGHFGYTPESPSTKVYHYHMQDNAPFTLGCFGPSATNTEVTDDECRALYPGCTDSSGLIDVVTYNGTSQYQTWCPCFFKENSSNVITNYAYPPASGASSASSAFSTTSVAMLAVLAAAISM